jgi:hypothetical protein
MVYHLGSDHPKTIIVREHWDMLYTDLNVSEDF